MSQGFFGTHGDEIRAADAAELRAVLEEIDLIVPGRTDGRRSEHEERYCVVHYLRALERQGLIEFPIKVSNGESPDFQVRMGGRSFGLEHTNAGSEEHHEGANYLEKAPPGSELEGPGLHTPSGEGVSGFRVREPGKDSQDRGAIGDEGKIWWTEEVLEAVQRKTEKLNAKDEAGRFKYGELPEYDLLVYDFTGALHLIGWNVDELPARLATAIREWREKGPCPEREFRRISVLRDRVMMYDVTGEALLLPVPASPTLPPLLPLSRLGVSEEDLQAFCRKHNIRKLGFFGSARGDRFGPESDVDVLVEFEPEQRIGLLGLAGLELELSELLGRKADLRTVPDLSRYFREEVVREKTDLAYARIAS